MKLFCAFLLSLYLVPVYAEPFFGSESGNGGASITCRDEQGALLRVDVLDLFEGFALFNRGYTELNTPAPEQARDFIPTIDHLFAGLSERSQLENLNSIIDRLRLLPDGVGLTPTEDWGNFIVPKGCTITQAVNFRDDGDIFADAEIWRAYSETEKAAAYIHELIYDYARQNGEEDTSWRTRTLVSLLFSHTPMEPILPQGLNEFCRAGDTEFYTSSSDDGKLTLFFTKIGGRAALARSVAISTQTLRGPLTAHFGSNLVFESRIESLVDRGMAVRLQLGPQGQELTLQLGSKKSTNSLNCQTKNKEN